MVFALYVQLALINLALLVANPVEVRNATKGWGRYMKDQFLIAKMTRCIIVYYC